MAGTNKIHDTAILAKSLSYLDKLSETWHSSIVMPIHEIADSQFADMAREAAEWHTGGCIFITRQVALGTLALRCEPLGLIVRPESDYEVKVGEHMAKAELVSVGRVCDNYIYPRENADRFVDYDHSRPIPPTLAQPPEVQLTGQPKHVNVSQAAALLHGTDPARIVFCTGAGISRAGAEPIVDYDTLCQQLGLGQNEDDVKNRQLRDKLLADAGACERALGLFAKFYGNLFADHSTPAHIAIASIIRTLDYEPTLITTNHDLKHQASGSRIDAVEIVNGWQASESYGLPAYQERRRLLARRALLGCVGSTDLAIIAGASASSMTQRGITAQLRRGNSDISVLGVNNQDKPPRYLGEHDYYLQGDAQEVLPKLNEALLAT